LGRSQGQEELRDQVKKAKITPEVEEGVVIRWFDEHSIIVGCDDGSEIHYDLGGFEIYKDGDTNYHVEEEEDALKVGDRVRITVVQHVEVLKRRTK
jgi:ribosomal protein S17